MRPFLFFTGAVIGWGAVALHGGAAEPVTFTSGPARVSLIELDTSEGCSSCPPAEKWLGELRDAPGLWRDFVPVALHVDYWNRLGWPDRFASRVFTERQYAYAAAWGSNQVYTPCFVRDGVEWRTCGGKIAAVGGAPAGLLTASYDGAVVRAEFLTSPASRGGEFEFHVALLGGGIVTKVMAGENRGETLRHEFVALRLRSGGAGRDISLPRSPVAGVTRHALAVWVTWRGELAPVQATGGWLE